MLAEAGINRTIAIGLPVAAGTLGTFAGMAVGHDEFRPSTKVQQRLGWQMFYSTVGAIGGGLGGVALASSTRTDYADYTRSPRFSEGTRAGIIVGGALAGAALFAGIIGANQLNWFHQN